MLRLRGLMQACLNELMATCSGCAARTVKGHALYYNNSIKQRCTRCTKASVWIADTCHPPVACSTFESCKALSLCQAILCKTWTWKTENSSSDLKVMQRIA